MIAHLRRTDQPSHHRTSRRHVIHRHGDTLAPASATHEVIVRGEIWRADLGLPRRSAPALRRPVVIVSADQNTRSRLQTVTVAVLTTTSQLAALPGNATIPADLGVLAVDSVLNVAQLVPRSAATRSRSAGRVRRCRSARPSRPGPGSSQGRHIAPHRPLAHRQPLRQTGGGHLGTVLKQLQPLQRAGGRT
jgi:mRNA interferase MazF